MGVNFSDNGDETSDCEVCGETIDNDHYSDMQVHDEKHRAEEAEAVAAPLFIVFRQSSSQWVVAEKYIPGNRKAYYRPISSSESGESADRIVEALR